MADTVNRVCGLNQTSEDLISNAGVTATVTELNKMDGVTSSTTELNTVDGVTVIESYFPFTKQNLASNTDYLIGSSTFVSVAGLAEVDGYYMARAGSVTSCAARLNTALTTETQAFRVVPYIANTTGTVTTLNGTVSIASTNGVHGKTTYTRGTKTFAAGYRVGLLVNSATNNIATQDISVVLGVST